MSDPRTTPFNGRVAHVSLKGKVDAKRFVEGESYEISIAIGNLCRTPTGPVDRQLLCGERFRVLDWPDDMLNGWAYGYAERDGYCGYMHVQFLHPATEPTHIVAARETYRKETPDLKTTERTFPLYLGSRVTVQKTAGSWAEIGLRLGGRDSDGMFYFHVPMTHLRPLDQPECDPVGVARRFLGTPYLWGGNSGRGIDCSGLVQAAMIACGWACPGDSDLQAVMPGKHLAESAALEPGDLIFWKGHVAIATGMERMIHANAHHMMVVEEPIDIGIARIAASGTGPVTLRLRPDRRPLPAF